MSARRWPLARRESGVARPCHVRLRRCRRVVWVARWRPRSRTAPTHIQRCRRGRLAGSRRAIGVLRGLSPFGRRRRVRLGSRLCSAFRRSSPLKSNMCSIRRQYGVARVRPGLPPYFAASSYFAIVFFAMAVTLVMSALPRPASPTWMTTGPTWMNSSAMV